MGDELDKKISFGVIILNYFSYQETINCVDAFQKAECSNYNVYYAIVDNGSLNDSYIFLAEKFKSLENINLIRLEKNVGFAGGNNAGLALLKSKYECDYYIFSNSDILVKTDVFSWIIETYKRNNCDILGPDIYAKNLGMHQNPIKKYTEKPFLVDIKICKKKVELIVLKLHIYWWIRMNRFYNSEVDIEKKQIFGCPVHGSFIITNNRFLNFYNDFFDSRTFLYMEEYLLYLRCKNAGLKTMVSLDNQVIHLQGRSTDADINNIRERKINRLSREISSMKIYKNELSKRKNKS